MDFGLIQSTSDSCMFSFKKGVYPFLRHFYRRHFSDLQETTESRRSIQISLIEIRREELGTSVLPRHRILSRNRWDIPKSKGVYKRFTGTFWNVTIQPCGNADGTRNEIAKKRRGFFGAH